MKVRLQKFLASAGIASRRKSENLILAGKIKVNGVIADKLGTEIDDETDVIECDNRPIRKEVEMVYIALNKPVDYISSATSAQGKSVMELVRVHERVYPVGRLDKDSCGLIVLTNDGEFANAMTHPKFEIEKEYRIILDKKLAKEDIKELERGIMIEGKLMKIFKVSAIGLNSARLILKEGANRQIRKMVGRLGYSILKLQRIRIAKLQLGDLVEGEWKKVKKEEII